MVQSYDEAGRQLDKLRDLLVGKTIIRIERPNASEAICTFVTNEASFRLHATDLGFWIEKTVEEGQSYPDITSWLEDYHNHFYKLGPSYNHEVPDPNVERKSDHILLISVDGKQFKLGLNLEPDELEIINHPRGLKRLSEAAACGDCWPMLFKPGWDGEDGTTGMCPKQIEESLLCGLAKDHDGECCP